MTITSSKNESIGFLNLSSSRTAESKSPPAIAESTPAATASLISFKACEAGSTRAPGTKSPGVCPLRMFIARLAPMTRPSKSSSALKCVSAVSRGLTPRSESNDASSTASTRS